MAYVHGHAACVSNGCPMYGRNQAECCSGEAEGFVEVVDPPAGRPDARAS
jgi:hypothetical protein